MSNFNEIMQQLRQEHAIVELPLDSPEKHLAEQVSHLLQQPAQQKLLGEQALKVVMQNQGASDTTLAEVKQLLGESA
jgi:3-deoxy-D-manno-octulosonic-acid transferase